MGGILQISHDYLGPFVSVCRQYTQAFSHCEVTTIYLRGEYSATVEEETGGGTVLFFEQKEGSLRGFKAKTLIRLYKVFKENQFDLVIAHRYKPLYLAGMMSYFFGNVNILGVFHEHGVLKRLHRKLFLSFWRKRIIILAVSDSVRKDLQRDCNSLVYGERLFVLNNAMDIKRYQSKILTREAARRELNLSQSDYIVGTLGRLIRKKKFDVLIKCFDGTKSDTRLVLIGDGPFRPELERLSEKSGLMNRVTFSGYRESGFKFLTAFDVFVLPSGIEEAFGYVLLEAMMARVPIIMADSEGPKEVAGDSAFLFNSGNTSELGEKIKEVQQLGSERLTELTDRGFRRLSEKFSLEKFSHDLLSLPIIAQSLENKK